MDDYERRSVEGWDDEVRYFCEHVVKQALVDQGVDLDLDVVRRFLSTLSGPGVRADLDRRVVAYLKTHDARGEVPLSDGSGFEDHCAQVLTAGGWLVELTPASGDQGVDIKAYRDGHFVVIQCKNFAKPVGNSAVQEVVAAREYLGAHVAVVVAPNGFSRAARELARATGVILLHQVELTTLAARIGD